MLDTSSGLRKCTDRSLNFSMRKKTAVSCLCTQMVVFAIISNQALYSCHRKEAEALRGPESLGFVPALDVPVPLGHVQWQSSLDLHVLHPRHSRGATLPTDPQCPGKHWTRCCVCRSWQQSARRSSSAAQQPQQAVWEAAAVDRQVVQISAR